MIINKFKNNKLIFFIFIICLTSICLYVYKFGFGLWSTPEKWGVFGDFFGGTLNPLLAFASLILLLKSLEQNNKILQQNEKALEINNKELSASRKELKRSAEAQEESKIYQARLTKIQELTSRISVITLLLEYDEVEVHNGTSPQLISATNLAGTSKEKVLKELAETYNELNKLKKSDKAH